MENRQISLAEEFQVFYVDAPLSRRWSTTPHSLRMGCTLGLPPKSTVWGEKQSTFTVEESDKHCLSQLITVNYSDKSC